MEISWKFLVLSLIRWHLSDIWLEDRAKNTMSSEDDQLDKNKESEDNNKDKSSDSSLEVPETKEVKSKKSLVQELKKYKKATKEHRKAIKELQQIVLHLQSEVEKLKSEERHKELNKQKSVSDLIRPESPKSGKSKKT
jgi:hypothetical protein